MPSSSESASRPDALVPPAPVDAAELADRGNHGAQSGRSERTRWPMIAIAGGLGAIVLVVIGWWLLRPPEVAVVEIKAGAVEVVLSVVGRVRPKNLIDVRSQNAGQIVQIFHDEGDPVAKGEPLAIVRSVVEQAQTQAEAARERAARAELDRAQLAFNRTRTLAARGFSARSALDEARAVLQSAEATLGAASATRRAAAARSGEFTIRAPMASVVLVRPVDNCQVVSSETILFQLGSRQGVELRAEADEAYADVLRTGMSARAALTGSDRVFVARVTDVSPRVDSVTGGRAIRLQTLDDIVLPPGRSVDITIIVARREAGIVVPRKAVINATAEPKVYVVDEGGVVRERAVKIADWPSRNAIVDQGLVAGDRVVLAPAETMPSAKVRVQLQSSASP